MRADLGTLLAKLEGPGGGGCGGGRPDIINNACTEAGGVCRGVSRRDGKKHTALGGGGERTVEAHQPAPPQNNLQNLFLN